MNNTIASLVKFHREWLKKSGKRILERDIKYLQEDVSDGSRQAFQQIPDSLDGLATYYGIRGTIGVLDGSEHGWEEISTAIDFRALSLRIRAELFFRNSGASAVNLTNYISVAACLACVSEKWSVVGEQVLQYAIERPNAVDHEYWTLRRFEPFVVACYKLRNGESDDRNELLDHPYGQVIESWSDVSNLANALKITCDYHCQNMDDAGGGWDPEFKHSPFDLLPCEVALVARVRKQLGLTMPAVKHDLVSLLEYSPEKIGVFEEHELVKIVTEAFERCFA